MKHDADQQSNQVEQFWEGFYQRQERIWSGNANPVLVDVASTLSPGTALDVGCGEGGDAIWLAQQGWQVTAVDVSSTALNRATIEAKNAGVASHIDFQQHDLASTFPAGTFDLVSAQYLQSPVEFPRERVLQAAARAVTPGGILLIVEHAQNPLPAPEKILTMLNLIPSEWHTERAETAQRQATGPQARHTAIMTDNIIIIRRLVNKGNM
jgi:2-polyprenyl-3-methyl-5-hydroxy-6-metoxy-1,4-benzoquinol methylase